MSGVQISINGGGTFTDVHASIPGHEDIILKVLSVDPANYSDAPTEGVRRILEIVTGKPHPRGIPLDTTPIELIRMGTTSVVEIDERITLEGYSENPNTEEIDVSSSPDLHIGYTGEAVRVIRKPDMNEGYRSLSIMFIHSYIYPQHEQEVGSLAREIGFSVVESAALQPMTKVVPRGMSATTDAYLTPTIRSYINSILANFAGGLAAPGLRCEFMHFSGLKSILSGPAGGIVGYAQTSWDEEVRKPIIGFDMGGTSTDCSRYAGTYEHIFETTIAGRNGLFAVGSESAGAHPGPACYRKGGPLAIIDAKLFLGRIAPEYFPKIFGVNEDQPLGTEIVAEKFAHLTKEINADNRAAGRREFTAQEVALRFLQVASEVMARPIRALTEARGYDTSDHTLACFGGAGGQHACDVARALSISEYLSSARRAMTPSYESSSFTSNFSGSNIPRQDSM
ncbi:Hydantoinase/oxoprolinase-domain-containing protein [Ilyonectria destructans]|nr:Hydantoinase/oxoprolinase-domain-containing protein [Ilyonectria destructans]